MAANCAMNRERQLAGVNSYARELGFDPLAFLSSRLGDQGPHAAPGWLDLCCGTGRALIQAATRLPGAGPGAGAVLIGVDLAGARRHQITRTGPARISLPYTYLGADDQAGPGYTGQPAVDSHYDEDR